MRRRARPRALLIDTKGRFGVLSGMGKALPLTAVAVVFTTAIVNAVAFAGLNAVTIALTIAAATAFVTSVPTAAATAVALAGLTASRLHSRSQPRPCLLSHLRPQPRQRSGPHCG